MVYVKNTTATAHWVMTDNKISFNGKGSNDSNCLFPSSNSAQSDAYGLQLYSNGFAFKGSDSASATVNASGNIYIYYAFAEAPLVGTNNIPAPEAGMFRFNTDESKFEGYTGNDWGSIGGSNTVDFTDVAGPTTHSISFAGLPFYLADSSFSPILMNAAGQIPFVLANGNPTTYKVK